MIDKVEHIAIRSYKHNTLHLNVNKNITLNDIVVEYRRLLKIMLNKQIESIYKSGNISNESKKFYGDIKTFLSERYKDVIKRQIDGQIKSYISNRKLDFKKYVYNSSLNDEQRKELYKINKNNSWFTSNNLIGRKIFKKILSKNRFPNTKNMNMVLNTKVYKLEENQKTKSCSYHILLNTCKGKRGDRIVIPIKTNTRFNKILEDKKATISNSITLVFDKIRKNELKSVVLSLKYLVKNTTNEYLKKENVIGLDFGLKNLITTSKGDFMSKNFINKITYYDDRIQKLTKELKTRNKKYKLSTNNRYNRLNHKCREFIKNEVCRVINRIIKIHNPDKFVLEDLNFISPKLSKRLNRLLTNCGFTWVKLKLIAVKEDLGIEHQYVNPAYTSQTCNKCNYVDGANRKTQKHFKCKLCGYEKNADINASRNILGRSYDEWFKSNPFASKFKIKQHILNKCMFSDGTSSCANVGQKPSKG